MRLKVATLAVGTEVTDGQIIDRNSAILSQLAVDLGFSVVEHRAVPDDREMIRQALNDLAIKANILFVTGGLGPTSDDFTRDLIAEFVGGKLSFDEASWKHVQETLFKRGVTPREMQKQQCYFPPNAKIYTNPAGTANAFGVAKGSLKIFALPGPPVEIMAVWNDSLKLELENLVPYSEREILNIWRTLGRGESDIAELVEPIVSEAKLRVGYRAHAPYVEVKVWSRPDDTKKLDAFYRLDEALGPYLVNRDKQDLAKDLLAASARFNGLRVSDFATAGLLSERLFSVVREEKFSVDLSIETTSGLSQSNPSDGLHMMIEAYKLSNEWKVTLARQSHILAVTVVKPIYNHQVDSDRGRKYICEKALQIAVEALAKKA